MLPCQISRFIAVSKMSAGHIDTFEGIVAPGAQSVPFIPILNVYHPPAAGTNSSR